MTIKVVIFIKNLKVKHRYAMDADDFVISVKLGLSLSKVKAIFDRLDELFFPQHR
jgi:hypothetical protein